MRGANWRSNGAGAAGIDALTMREHILAGLAEEFERWDAQLAALEEASACAPRPGERWSVKETVLHLWAWQQRTVARVAAAVAGGEPELPVWAPDLDPGVEAHTAPLNDRLRERYRDEPWPAAHAAWRAGFRRLLDLAERVSEPDLLEAGRYPWLGPLPLSFILTASYAHHAEHYELLWSRP